jgi:hypothetical protein
VLLVALTVPEPPAHLATFTPVTRPLEPTVMFPVGVQVVVVPQQLVLQATVLASLIVAVALIWTEASSAMVAVVGAMVMLVTVVLLVTVIVETLLTCVLLVAVTVPEPPAHFGTSEPVTRPLEPTVTFPVGVQVVAVPQQPVLHAAVLPSLIVAVALICTPASSLMLALVGAMATLETVSILVTVIVETLLTWVLLVALTVPEPPAHLATFTPVTRPLEPTVMFPVGVQVVVVPQQPVLQATVLASLIVAVALIWTEASSAMVAVVGAMVMLETVLIFVTVTLSTGLVMPLLLAVTVPEPLAHFGTSVAVTRPLEPTVILPVEL